MSFGFRMEAMDDDELLAGPFVDGGAAAGGVRGVEALNLEVDGAAVAPRGDGGGGRGDHGVVLPTELLVVNTRIFKSRCLLCHTLQSQEKPSLQDITDWIP